MKQARLTYFGSRGRAELVRLTCALGGVQYQEDSVGAWNPTTYPEPFVAMRNNGLLAFEQLPLWEEPGGFRLVQSDAIVRHLARTHGLYGNGAHEMARVDELLEGTKDAFAELYKLLPATPEARPGIRAHLIERAVPRWLGFFETLAVRNGGGFGLVGVGPTVADAAVFHWIEVLSDNDLLPVERHPWSRLMDAQSRLLAIPRFATYVRSEGRPPIQSLPR